GPPRAYTIYFGGGTPSLMNPGEVEKVIAALGRRFRLVPEGVGGREAEITLEVNPTAALIDQLSEMKELGVNRLSVGCQSFDDKFLTLLGRDHDAATARRVLTEIREIGYTNVSLDLMFGLPGQTLGHLCDDLEVALAFSPEHISVYGLTLHEGTPFKRWHDEGRLEPVDSDLTASMFEHLIGRMADAGYDHYEISNWSRPGLASRHNSKYWRRCDVFAFGASAHGVIAGRRYSRVRDLKMYLGSGEKPDEARDEIPPQDDRAAAGEIMLLALRRIQGVQWDELTPWMGRDPRQYYRSELALLEEEGLIEETSSCLRLTPKGILFADTVTRRFF
ncbi:radical SAM family heme chaperone HemW, partial [Candidatus Sumerlaeota bacterium]|nr:radical SAM family heme chaperone HemW [Candidatus Sumerlaeota bacterium]